MRPLVFAPLSVKSSWLGSIVGLPLNVLYYDIIMLHHLGY